MPENPFIRLTSEFNEGGLRAIVCSGQAVVLHRLAMMSKDGDWIVSESAEDLAKILAVLASHGARYRYGAPLDVRWLEGGWSAHLEFYDADGMRVRTDFFSRPPRIGSTELASLWAHQGAATLPFVPLRELALMKMTQREKDYPIIGELARRMPELRDRLEFSRSAIDLISIANTYKAETLEAMRTRPLLKWALDGDREQLGMELDSERRKLMREDAARLHRFQQAAVPWMEAWPEVERATRDLPLDKAHSIVTAAAEEHLPFKP